MDRSAGERTGRTVLAVVTVVAVGPQLGALVLPFLVPFHVWAARRSGPVGRVLWSFGPVAAAGISTWAVVYLAAGEAKPQIWLLPVAAAVAAAVGMGAATRRAAA